MVYPDVGVTIKWPGGKRDMAQFRRDVGSHIDTILNKSFLAVDPASNALGWAVFNQGKYETSGILKAPARYNVPQRLQYLYDEFKLVQGHPLLLVESIRSARLSQIVKYAVGMTIVASRCPDYIECPIPVWKAVAAATHTYTKSDEQDAIMIGVAAILVAQEIDNARDKA
jgi:hypothetical protein